MNRPHLAGTPNGVIDAVLLGAKSQLVQKLSGFEEKSKMKMAHAVELTMDELTEIEERSLPYLSTHGREARIVSNKTQVSTDGELRPRGLHVSVVFQRSDPG